MMRYYNTETKCEVLKGIHSLEGSVALPEDHIVFQPMPKGKCFIYDVDQIPVGYKDILKSKEDRIAELESQITSRNLRGYLRGDDPYAKEKIDSIDAQIKAIRSE